MSFPHQAVAASAGSGKTYQLAHRYIRLLAAGVPPERIVALTFSRKAAGEIFDKIVGYLSLAADSEAEADRMNGEIGEGTGTPASYRTLLRKLFDSLHRLHVGTMDSFTIGIIRAFPLELGIPPDFTVADTGGDEAEGIRREVLAGILQHWPLDYRARSEFQAAFQEVTFGEEEKSLDPLLARFVERFQARYRLLPDGRAWGVPERIWPDGCVWLGAQRRIEEDARVLDEWLSAQDWDARFVRALLAIVRFAGAYTVRSPWAFGLSKTLAESLFSAIDELRDGSATITYSRKSYPLDGDPARRLYRLLHHVMHVELQRVLTRTRGLFRVLDLFDYRYDEWMRRRGVLTFDDVQYLLTDRNRYSGGACISREAGAARRLFIDYRLDGALDHWLLDEFQDTSALQWEVFRNLVDELVQDTSGARSFFYVGDVKQAIYGWRGGDASLFGRLLEMYGGRIEQRTLSASYRSSAPIMETVNRVFSSLPGELPEGAVQRWRAVWSEHTTERKELSGYVALIEPLHDKQTKAPAEDRYRAVAAVLREIEPVRRGLSTAVLVRKNREGRELVDYLRAHLPGVPVVHEGRAAILDNALVPALLSLIRYAAHPADTAAWRHVQMSPFRRVFQAMRLGPNELPLHLLQELHRDGFRRFLENWAVRLEAYAPLDAFARRRLQDVLRAAFAFEHSGRRDVQAFLRFIELYELHEPAGEAVVRVMTTHQAKGLEFDLVVLPALMDGNLRKPGRTELFMANREHPDRAWVLQAPRRLVAETDLVLAEQLEQVRAEDCYDELCALYVAMTRAKRALYMVTSHPGRASSTLSPAALIKKQLAPSNASEDVPRQPYAGEILSLIHETGARDWYEQEHEPPAPRPEPPQKRRERPASRKRYRRIAPSEEAAEEESAGLLFTASLRDSLQLGSAVHALFERVEWLDTCALESLIETWSHESALPRHGREAAIEHFRRAVAAKEIRTALTRPPHPVELWREKAFEIVRGDHWISGIFDRVVLEPSGDGYVSAVILDYKSNDVAEDESLARLAEHYRPQLERYREVLSEMTALASEQIALRLLFTLPGKVVDLGARE